MLMKCKYENGGGGGVGSLQVDFKSNGKDYGWNYRNIVEFYWMLCLFLKYIMFEMFKTTHYNRM
jgi:hypothetical protein